MKTKNISIIFKDVKTANVNKNFEPKLYTRKNMNYVNDFNEVMKKAIKEYEKTPRAAKEEKIGDVESPMNEFFDAVADDSIY